MKTVSSDFAWKAFVAAGGLLASAAAVAQPAPPAGSRAESYAVLDATPRPTSSNPWDSLPAMSAHRCLAEAIGTASDPNTGAPVRASVNPETGKPLCQSVEAMTAPKPAR